MRFLSYYVGQRHLFFIDMACALVIAVTELAFPQILRQLASGLFTEGEDAILGSLVFVAIGLIAMYVLHFFCRVFVISWGHIMGARMESHMREDLFDAYERMGFSYYDRHKTGDLMSRLVSDLFDISETAHHGPEYLVIGVMEIVGSFVILSFINVPLTLVMAAIAALRASALDVDPLYINFTSGSTGTPKGVAVCHRSVIDFIEFVHIVCKRYERRDSGLRIKRRLSVPRYVANLRRL